MSTKDGWVQGYNCQAIANPQQIVIACEVSQDANDVQQYEPMIGRLEPNAHAARGSPTAVELALADAGYCSEENAHLRRARPADRDPQGPQTAPRRPRARAHRRPAPARRDRVRADGAPAPHPARRRRLQAALLPDRTRSSATASTTATPAASAAAACPPSAANGPSSTSPGTCSSSTNTAQASPEQPPPEKHRTAGPRPCPGVDRPCANEAQQPAQSHATRRSPPRPTSTTPGQRIRSALNTVKCQTVLRQPPPGIDVVKVMPGLGL